MAKASEVSVRKVAEESGTRIPSMDREHPARVSFTLDQHDRRMARLCKRIEAIEEHLGITVYDENLVPIKRAKKAKTAQQALNEITDGTTSVLGTTDSRLGERKLSRSPGGLKRIGSKSKARAPIDPDEEYAMTGEGSHEEEVLRKPKGMKAAPHRAKKEYTEAERKAIGVRLQTARAAKMGLTLAQMKFLGLRPGVQPTATQVKLAKRNVKE